MAKVRARGLPIVVGASSTPSSSGSQAVSCSGVVAALPSPGLAQSETRIALRSAISATKGAIRPKLRTSHRPVNQRVVWRLRSGSVMFDMLHDLLEQGDDVLVVDAVVNLAPVFARPGAPQLPQPTHVTRDG